VNSPGHNVSLSFLGDLKRVLTGEVEEKKPVRVVATLRYVMTSFQKSKTVLKYTYRLGTYRAPRKPLTLGDLETPIAIGDFSSIGSAEWPA